MHFWEFNEVSINTLPEAYKLKYINHVREAVMDYLNWSNTFAHGFRFSHLFHGETGRQRAHALRQASFDYENFFDLVKRVSEAMQTGASGITHHSLKRYLFRHFTGKSKSEVHDISDGDFFTLHQAQLIIDLKHIGDIVEIKHVTPLALAESVRLASKHLDDPVSDREETPIALNYT